MPDELIVQKYGGSSLDSPEKIKAIAQKIAQRARGHKRIIVTVSAMGKTTDSLLSLAHDISPTPSWRELDMLLTVGERISMALLSMALNAAGVPAISFTGSQSGIVTSTIHTHAIIEEIRADRILQALDEGKVAIIAGFQGVSRMREITTLGRGGSDTTAVALASWLHANKCEIYSDYPGLFTADPRHFPQARRIPEISHDEMLELASLGAKVLHYRAADIARRGSVRLLLLSSFEDTSGTLVQGEAYMEALSIKSITSNSEVGLVSASFKASDASGKKLSAALEESGTEVIFYQASTARDITTAHCVIELTELAKLESVFKGMNLGDLTLDIDRETASVSVIGSGFCHKVDALSAVERSLGGAGIRPMLSWTSPLSATCLVPRETCKRAVAALHETFFPE
jgi:aspartate kinase